MLNVLLLTNYVVAIMTDRYAAMQQSRLGLLHDGQVSSMNEYKYDSRYGFLVSNLMPLNFLSLLVSPLLLVIKNDETLRQMNTFMSIIGYLPFALVTTAVFMAASIVMVPFAYLAALGKKFQLIFQSAEARSVIDLIFFLVFGLILLAVRVPIDSCYFYWHLFSFNADTVKDKLLVDELMTLEEFKAVMSYLKKIEKS